MSGITEEIWRAKDALGLSDERIRRLPQSEGLAVVEAAEAHFVASKNRTWWWEDFRVPATHLHFADGQGWQHLTALVPSASEVVWFIAAEDDWPVYEADTATVQAVIGQCYAIEYYLVAKDCCWLLCESHSDQLFAIGEPVERSLAGLAKINNG